MKMRSMSLESSLGQAPARTAAAPPPATTPQSSKTWVKNAVIASYAAVTVLELTRGTIHTFFYETGLDDISGLATGDSLCDGRLAILMLAYGGANLESFLLRAYVLYIYARYGRGRDLVRVTSIASALWHPVTNIASSLGYTEVGDAAVPGRYAMLARSVVSLGTLFLTYVSS